MTIEDAAELQLQQRHVVSLEARPPNIEGEGEVRIRELVRNALRMRPDRIIVGEVRGAETLDMLQAMNTGHEGSLTTIHANTPRDALHRLEMLVLMGGVELPLRAVREQIASAFDLIVHLIRLVDGSRRVSRITEVFGLEGDVVTLQDLFVTRGADDEGMRARRALEPARAAPLDRAPAELHGQAGDARRRDPGRPRSRRHCAERTPAPRVGGGGSRGTDGGPGRGRRTKRLRPAASRCDRLSGHPPDRAASAEATKPPTVFENGRL